MADQTEFYICPRCFEVREFTRASHRHRMVRCDPGAADSDRRKPPVDGRGQLITRAPRWYLEAVGILRAR